MELWPLMYGWQSGRNYEELEINQKGKKADFDSCKLVTPKQDCPVDY